MKIARVYDQCYLFVDTSVWMDPAFEHYVGQTLLAAVYKRRKKLHVCTSVQEEINRFARAENLRIRNNALNAVKLLNRFVQLKMVEAHGGSFDSPEKVFRNIKASGKLAILTQDESLAKRLEELNKHSAIKDNSKLLLLYIQRNGVPAVWPFSSAVLSSPFELGTKVDASLEIPLPVQSIPEEFETVQAPKYGELLLSHKLGGGGEGKVYQTSQGLVCKIFDRHRLTEGRREKIRLMLSSPFEMEGICWPKEWVMNRNHEFVGYVMDLACGKRLQTSIMSKAALTKHFPHWTRLQLVQVCLTILEKLDYLHERNVIIGDLNPLNILIKDERLVYFVDTDSYQIGNYPCTVGTAPFTPGVLQGKDFGSFLRGFQHDYFAIAVLLFMIMLPGRHPFDHKGGTTAEENMKKGIFPYRYKEKPGHLVPEGPWRNMWSHLSPRLRDMFHETFQAGNHRYTAKAWIQAMNDYKDLLQKGRLCHDIFPETVKIPDSKKINVNCKTCGRQHEAHKDHVGQKHGPVCSACQTKAKVSQIIQQVRSKAK